MKALSFSLIFLITFLGTCSVFAQGDTGVTFISSIPARVKLMEKVHFNFRVDTNIVSKYQYKLDVPGDWKGGFRMIGIKWSQWQTDNGKSILYNDFPIEGNYKFVVRMVDKRSQRQWDIEKSFKAYWEYPEIRSEAMHINFNYINSAPTQKEKYRRAAEEYGKQSNIYLKKAEYELRQANLVLSTKELVNIIAKKVLTQSSKYILAQCGHVLILENLITAAGIYGLIKLGYSDFAIAYRNAKANSALNSASVALAAQKAYTDAYVKST
jgi:hypothetical protein